MANIAATKQLGVAIGQVRIKCHRRRWLRLKPSDFGFNEIVLHLRKDGIADHARTV